MRKIVVLALLVSVTALSAEESPLEVVVNTSVNKPLPIAVVPFKTSDPNVPVDVATVIRNDLERSGRFAPIPMQDKSSRAANLSKIHVEGWRRLSMPHMVVGKGDAGGGESVELR